MHSSKLMRLLILIAMCGLPEPQPAQACRQWAAPPLWLKANPPVEALLLPNREVITLGKLGCAVRMQYWRQGQPLPEDAGRWYRYSSGGRLIAGLPAGVHWWVHYFTDYDAVADYWAQRGAGSADYRGYLIFEYRDGRRAALYDYDGTALPLDLNLDASAQRYRHLRAAELSGGS